MSNWRVDSYKRHLIVLLVLMLMWVGLWVTSGVLEKREFKNGGSEAQLWLACFFGPLGVWIRWWLARLNGRGLGKAGLYKWLPFGTLAANVSAACVMAALATVKKAVSFCSGIISWHLQMQSLFLFPNSPLPAKVKLLMTHQILRSLIAISLQISVFSYAL